MAFQLYRLNRRASIYLEKQISIPVSYTVNFLIHEQWAIHGAVSSQDQKIRIMDLQSRTYSCGEFQEKKFPCRHAIKLIKAQELHIIDYINELYTVETYQSIYRYCFPPLDAFDLAPDPYYKEPPKNQLKALLKSAESGEIFLKRPTIAKSTDR